MTPSERLAYLKSLDAPTAQEVFDLTVLALRIQGCKATTERTEDTEANPYICVYRTKSGLACAAGHHIRDTEYLLKMENLTIGKLLDLRVSETLSERLLPHILLITRLQRIHDQREPAQWEDDWFTLAREEDVVYTPPEV